MNIVLGDAEEFRRVKLRKETKGAVEERDEKRSLGLIILRGDSVVSMTVEGPPPLEDGDKTAVGGPGIGKVISRGLPVAPIMNSATVGLTGPVLGVGGPAHALMQPSMQGS